MIAAEGVIDSSYALNDLSLKFSRESSGGYERINIWQRKKIST